MTCHNAVDRRDGVDLTSYEVVVGDHAGRKFLESFNPLGSAINTVLSAKGARHMPPLDRPQLTSDKIILVYLWIENGAKATAGGEAPRPASLKDRLQPYFEHPEAIDYTVVKNNVLAVSCMKCHSKAGDAPDKTAIANSANMTTYQALFNVFTPIVVKGKPEESKLYQAPAVTQSMPPARLGYDPIESLRLKLLRLWILNCAIEDKAALGNEVLTPDPNNSEKVRVCPETSPVVLSTVSAS